MSKDLFFYLCYFWGLVFLLNFVLHLLLDDFDWSPSHWKILQELFHGNELRSCFFDPHKGLLKSFHRNVAWFRVIPFSPHKRIFFNLKSLIYQNLRNNIISVQVLSSLIQILNRRAYNFVNCLWNVRKSHFILILQTLYKTKNVIFSAICVSGLKISDKLRPRYVLSCLCVLLRAKQWLNFNSLKNSSETHSFIQFRFKYCRSVNDIWYHWIECEFFNKLQSFYN